MTESTLLIVRREAHRYPFSVRPVFRPYNNPNQWHGVVTLGRLLIRWRWNWLQPDPPQETP